MIMLANGERLPLLISTETGLPLEAPTFWSIALRRAQNVQANTIRNELRHLVLLYLWADANGIEVGKRLEEGEFFSLAEVLDFVSFAGRFIEDILAELDIKIVRLGTRVRKVGASEHRNRLATAYSFIEFTTADILSKLTPWPQRWDRYHAGRALCLANLKPHLEAEGTGRRDDLGQRQGLEDAAIERLRQVIEPDHPENPFEQVVRFRNYMIVRLLLDTGIRRGELLGIKVPDCSLGSLGSLTIHRRPDDPDDPRREKPGAKTLARPVPLNGRLTEIVHEWIVHYRAKIDGARRHPFLIVSARSGAPLSLSSINKMFEALRSKVSGLPDDLSPHVMRHSWNDAFSDLMDKKGVAPDQEKKWRARLMGWRSEESASHYVRRTVRRRADAALREMQDGFVVRGSIDAD